jgi:hypothetical protein
MNEVKETKNENKFKRKSEQIFKNNKNNQKTLASISYKSPLNLNYPSENQ